jgi:hypothetical protein
MSGTERPVTRPRSPCGPSRARSACSTGRHYPSLPGATRTCPSAATTSRPGRQAVSLLPVRPENRARYPKNWKIVARIRTRSRNRCEFIIDGKRCKARNGKPHPITRSIVVLPVAHLDRQPENCTHDNLKPPGSDATTATMRQCGAQVSKDARARNAPSATFSSKETRSASHRRRTARR